MREIKFRGKRLDNGEWIEGDLLRMNDHWFIFPDPEPEGIDKYEVDPATVGEFTGLKDKNGKEIYEGDIMDMEVFGEEDIYFHCPVLIIFIDGAFHIAEDEESVWAPICNICISEVIGNIHDNLELLKGGEQ